MKLPQPPADLTKRPPRGGYHKGVRGAALPMSFLMVNMLQSKSGKAIKKSKNKLACIQ